VILRKLIFIVGKCFHPRVISRKMATKYIGGGLEKEVIELEAKPGSHSAQLSSSLIQSAGRGNPH
jgi:hypothetical protein